MKKLIVIFSVLIMTACGGQNKIDQLGNKGTSLFNKGKIKKALKKFNEIIELDSLNAEAYTRKADCLDLLGDTKGCIQSYSKALEIDPDNKIAFFNRAHSHEKTGEINKALADYLSAIESDPDNESELNNSLIYHNLGILYGKNKEFDKAIQSFNNAIKINSKYADAYHNLGYAYQLKGDHENAIYNFDKALELDPESEESNYLKSLSVKELN